MSRFVLANVPDTRRSGRGNQLYDLAAVIVHHGSGAGSGHYTAFAINEEQWFHFNDQTVRAADAGAVAACKPYILFYIRRELALPPAS
ncbi:ubiquitin carboxyl-terminal hydrolase 3-like [Manduca sexta]|nr:ubiquitin carboxyl-terminal hydrolase 3-like [Manduca sexta]